MVRWGHFQTDPNDDRPGRINNNSLVLAVGETIYSVQIKGAIRWSPVGTRQKIALTSWMLGYVGGWVLQFWGFSGFPSKMVKTNQRRKQDKTRSTQKKMPGPEVQQLHNVGPPVARWRVPTSFSFCTCPLYFAWVFLSYLMPSHFIGIFSLGPCILFYFFRCLTPPLATDEGYQVYIMVNQ